MAASRLLPQTAGFASNVSKAHLQAIQDVRAQLEWLLHKRFIADTPYERLQHVPRYLKAINLRIEKLRSNPARDAQCMAQMQPLTQAWQKLRQMQQGKQRSAHRRIRLDVAGTARVAVRAGTEDAGDRVGEKAGEDTGGDEELMVNHD